MEKIKTADAGFKLLFPEEERERKKKIRLMPVICAALLVLVMVVQCFTVDAYATIYCTACGSPYIYGTGTSALYIYHRYRNSSGECPGGNTQLRISITEDETESEIVSEHSGVLTTSNPGMTTYAEVLTHQCSSEGEISKIGSSDDDEDADETIVIAGDLIDTVFGTADDGEAGSVFEPLTILEDSCGIIVSSMETIMDNSFYRALQVIGMSLMTVFFLMEFAAKDVHKEFGQPTLEAYLHPLGRFFVALMILYYTWTFLQLFLYLAQFAYYQLSSLSISAVFSASGDSGIQTKIGKAVGYVFGATSWKDELTNTLLGIGLTLTFLVPWFLTQIANGVAIWVIFSRTVTLVIMGTLAPVAMSDLYSDRPIQDTRAFGFFRKYAGVAFQCIVIPLVFFVVNLLALGYVEDLVELANSAGTVSVLGNIALYISILKVVQVAAVFGSSKAAKEVFGAA